MPLTTCKDVTQAQKANLAHYSYIAAASGIDSDSFRKLLRPWFPSLFLAPAFDWPELFS